MLVVLPTTMRIVYILQTHTYNTINSCFVCPIRSRPNRYQKIKIKTAFSISLPYVCALLFFLSLSLLHEPFFLSGFEAVFFLSSFISKIAALALYNLWVHAVLFCFVCSTSMVCSFVNWLLYEIFRVFTHTDTTFLFSFWCTCFIKSARIQQEFEKQGKNSMVLIRPFFLNTF